MTQITKFYKPIKDKDRYMKFNLKWKNKAKRMIKNAMRVQIEWGDKSKPAKILKKMIDDKHTRTEVKPYLERKLNEIRTI